MVGLYSLLAPDVFRSDAKLLVRPGRGSITIDPTVATGQLMEVTQSQESLINSEVEILRSRALAARVVWALGPEGSLGRGAADPTDDRTSPAEEEAVEKLQENLAVEALKESNVVRIRYKARSPGTAQEVVAKVIEFYLDQHIGAHRTTGSHAFFVRETERARQALAETETNLRDLKNKARIGALDEQQRILLHRIGELERERQNAATGMSASKVEVMRAMLSSLPETLVTQETSWSNSAADAMRAKLYELQLKEQDYLSKFREEADPVREVRRQIAEAEALIEKEGRMQTQITSGLNSAHEKVKGDVMTEEAALSAQRAKERVLKDELARAQQELRLFNENEVQLTQLETQLRIHNDNYNRYAESMEQARIDSALESERISSISVVQPPTYVAIPVGPRRLLILVIGGILGSLAMLGIVVVSEFLDQTMSDPMQVEEKLRVPSLAAIPELPKQHLAPAVGPTWATLRMPGQEDPDLVGPEPGRQLVVPGAIQRSESLFDDLVASANGVLKYPCVLAVTSCRRREGVTTVAASIAASLRLNGPDRVLLVDTKAIRRSVLPLM